MLTASAILVPATASAQPCSDVTVVFARGTGEPPGIGRVGQAFVDALRPQLGDRTLSSYGVNYPASYDFVLAADGAADASTYVSNIVATCPTTRIVLGGFSQGAAVVDMLAGVPPLGNRLGAVGPMLPPTAVSNVAAVAVFGNPATKFGNPITSSVFGGRDRSVHRRRPDLLARPEPVRPQQLRRRRAGAPRGELRGKPGLGRRLQIRRRRRRRNPLSSAG